jgi:Na+-translocating ferredoxin:NAD+ oxidoreductase RnfD subunit
LPAYSPGRLGAIAGKLGACPRKHFDWKCLIEFITETVALRSDTARFSPVTVSHSAPSTALVLMTDMLGIFFYSLSSAPGALP